jgi:KDO2-lipid IV(A) lauroyltransferase
MKKVVAGRGVCKGEMEDRAHHAGRVRRPSPRTAWQALQTGQWVGPCREGQGRWSRGNTGPLSLELLLKLSSWPASRGLIRALGPHLLPPGVARALRANGRLVQEALRRSAGDKGPLDGPSPKSLAVSYVRSRLSALELLSGHPQPVSIPNSARIREALAEGRGVLMLSAHIGCWELGAASLTRYAPVHSVAGIQMRSAWTPSLRRRLRDLGFWVHSSPWVLSRLRSSLQKGEIVSLQMDGDQGGRGLPARILGRETTLPGGAAWLAANTGCVVLSGACVWEDGQWVGHTDRPIRLPVDTSSNPVTRWHETLTRETERMILRWHEQWILPSPLAGERVDSCAAP